MRPGAPSRLRKGYRPAPCGLPVGAVEVIEPRLRDVATQSAAVVYLEAVGFSFDKGRGGGGVGDYFGQQAVEEAFQRGVGGEHGLPEIEEEVPGVAVEALQGADGGGIGPPAHESRPGQGGELGEARGADDADGSGAVVARQGVPVVEAGLREAFQGGILLIQVGQGQGIDFRHAGADHFGDGGYDGLRFVFQFVGHFHACHIAVLEEDEAPLPASGQGQGGSEIGEFQLVVAVYGHSARGGGLGYVSSGSGIRVLQPSGGQPGGAVGEDDKAVAAGGAAGEHVAEHLRHDGGIGGVLRRIGFDKAAGSVMRIGDFHEPG